MDVDVQRRPTALDRGHCATAAAGPVHARPAALAVLSKELGIVETVRFLAQFGTGSGDYTRERDTTFRGLTMDEIVSEIRRTPAQAS